MAPPLTNFVFPSLLVGWAISTPQLSDYTDTGVLFRWGNLGSLSLLTV